MKCDVCKTDMSVVLNDALLGYFEGRSFSVYKCLFCNTNFVRQNEKGGFRNLYEYLYLEEESAGYDRYHRYAQEIRGSRLRPLQYLADQERTYIPINLYLDQKKKSLDILEVGCGVGYLTYAMSMDGNRVKGIDISKAAVKKARELFPGINVDVSSTNKESKKKKRYDLVVACEVIEHVENPKAFFDQCMKVLKTGGELLITTPNRSYYCAEAVWDTELPPLHRFWFTHWSFLCMKVGHKGSELERVEFDPKHIKRENILFDYWNTRKPRKHKHYVLKGGEKNQEVHKKSAFRSLLRKVFIKNDLVRTACNRLAYFIHPHYKSLYLIIKKGEKRK